MFAKSLGTCMAVLIMMLDATGTRIHAQQPSPSLLRASRAAGWLKGTVTAKDGAAFGGARVLIQSGTRRWEVGADENGAYTIELPTGVYSVVVEPNCPYALRLTGVRIIAGVIRSLNVQLKAVGECPQAVSLLELIATPERYHEKRIRVEGYLHQKFEDSALYLSKTDADYLLSRNALWLSYNPNGVDLRADGTGTKVIDLAYFDCKYVSVEGVFNKKGRGHFGRFSGEIQNVTRVRELKRYYDGVNSLKPGEQSKEMEIGPRWGRPATLRTDNRSQGRLRNNWKPPVEREEEG